MFKNNDLSLLTYRYCRILAKKQPYKIQFMAMNSYFNNHNLLVKNKIEIKRHYKQYMISNFSSSHIADCKMIRDFAFKHDFMTPRQSMLFTPKGYLYYTEQVFQFAAKIKKLKINETLNFSTDHVKVFYTGFLKITPYDYKEIKENTDYKKSYRQFQEILNSFSDNRILKLDIQNFFLGITIKRLQTELIKLPYHTNIPELFNILKFLKNSGYTTLPQSQGSLASSILSQFYLTRFTEYLESISLNYSLEIIRYVDDTYIKLPNDISNKEINEIINGISSELWKYGLNINIKKTRVIDKKDFKKFFNFESETISGIDSSNNIMVPKHIGDKVDELLKYDGKKILEFLSRVRKIHKKYGNDMNKYKELSFKYFNVNNDDANKVQNTLIFGQKWKKVLTNNSKKKIIQYTEIINFDPEKYVLFLLQVEKSINNNKNNINIVETYIKKHVHNKKYYSVREGLIDSNYYVQSKNNLCALDRIIYLNKSFYNFILGYIQ